MKQILDGKLYHHQIKTIFPNEINHSYNEIESNDFDPFGTLEKSISLFEIDNKKLNIFNYFHQFNEYISSLKSTDKSKSNESSVFINSLCQSYIGHNLYLRIKEEISPKTNLNILKGDYLFSNAYLNISKLGNMQLINRFYQISEVFSKSLFSYKKSGNLENKFISFIYLGCLGLNEVFSNLNSSDMLQLIINYGTLVYLKEELSNNNKINKQYESENSMDVLFFALKNVINFVTDNKAQYIEQYSKKINSFILKKNDNEKIKNISVNLSFEILILIDKLGNNTSNKSTDVFKGYIRSLLKEIEAIIKSTDKL